MAKLFNFDLDDFAYIDLSDPVSISKSDHTPVEILGVAREIRRKL